MSLTATIWPSPEALAQGVAQKARQSGCLRQAPLDFTFDSLLPKLLADLDLEPGRCLLPPLAGPMLIHHILQRTDSDKANLFNGLTKGHRLPSGLWRLLVEIKAAGLAPQQLSQMKSRRISSLAWLLAEYNQELEQRNLLDQADGLACLERDLGQGRAPDLMRDWGELIARDVLWLRTMDLRLLRAVAQVAKVTVQFSLVNPRKDPGRIYGLMENTAQILEADLKERLEVVWQGVDEESGPLAEWLLEQGMAPESPPPPGNLELARGAGRYGEVEALVKRALALAEAGADPSRIGLVFPDLEVYGQMAMDVARRMGLPLASGQAAPLTSLPLVAAFFDLIRLPLVSYAREDLRRVLESPYLRALWQDQDSKALLKPVSGVGELLCQAGYVDASQEPDWPRLERANPPNERISNKIQLISKCCVNISQKLAKISQHFDLKDYISELEALLQSLRLERAVLGSPGEIGAAKAKSVARDLAGLSALQGFLQDAGLAAQTLDLAGEQAPDKLWEILHSLASRSMVGAKPLPLDGVRLLSLAQAQGLELDHLLLGGLNQGEFPRRPADGQILTSADRLSLGHAAKMPVWRTDQEEYSGQQLRLVNLLCGVRKSAVLSCSAANATGNQLEPAFFLRQVAVGLGRDIPKAKGGIYGSAPPLDQAYEIMDLWSALSKDLLLSGLGSGDHELGQGALFQLLARDANNVPLWQDLAQRSQVETRRFLLDLEPFERRLDGSDRFSGLLGSGQSLKTLAAALARHQKRLSASSLETYAACPAQWFWSYLLGLYDLPEPGFDLERNREGQWVHLALKLFFDPSQFDSWDEFQQAKRMEQCLDQARQLIEDEGHFGHAAVWDSRRPILLQALSQVVKRECQALEDLKPVRVEEAFGRQDSPFEMALLSNPARRLGLVGQIDRIDQGPERLWVSDYKHSKSSPALRDPLKQANWAMGAFQLPLYLVAAKAMFAPLEPGERLRARLVPTARLSDKLKEPELEANDPLLASEAQARLSARNAEQINLFNAIEDIWLAMEAGRFMPRPDKQNCSYCHLGAICRSRLTPSAAQGEQS